MVSAFLIEEHDELCVFDLTVHFFERNAVVQQAQKSNNITDWPRVVSNEDDTRMRVPAQMQSKKIGIVCHDHPAVGRRKLEMRVVGSADQVCIARRLRIDPSQLQTTRDRMIDVLIKMESDFRCHPCGSACGRAGRDRCDPSYR